MAHYTTERRLSHADVDFLGELKVSALLGLLEQAAVEASTAAGFDAARYTRDGRLWIIRRTRLQRFVPVGGTDLVEVATHGMDFRRARSLRHYAIRRGTTVVADATTDWVYCDLHSGRPVRIPEDLRRALSDGAIAPLLPRAKALPAGDSAPAVTYEVITQPSHLDHVTHVNNAVYANFLEDAAFTLFTEHGWPLGRMLEASGALRLDSLDYEYLSDAAVGECLIIRSWLAAGAGLPSAATVLQTVVRADGNTVMRAQSTWAWRRKPQVIGGAPPA